jgi:chorismate synthase
MSFEQDRVEVLGGVRHGTTLGSPVTVVIHNTEWPKWVDAMDPEPRDDIDQIRTTGRGQRLTRPRPGHADLTGALKYGYDDVRDALERASARETAARVVVGTYAKHLLAEVGVHVVSHVVEIGGVRTPADAARPGPDDLAAVDESPVRCLDAATEAEMVARIDAAHADNDTLGGTIEVLVHGAPAGLGSHVHWDRKLDARLAAACLSVQAMKGVEFGDGFDLASRPGSQAHDEIVREADGSYRRLTDRAGGIEAGMTTGQPVRLRVAMKPISSLPRPLATVDLDTHEPAQAITQRSDACAVPGPASCSRPSSPSRSPTPSSRRPVATPSRRSAATSTGTSPPSRTAEAGGGAVPPGSPGRHRSVPVTRWVRSCGSGSARSGWVRSPRRTHRPPHRPVR